MTWSLYWPSIVEEGKDNIYWHVDKVVLDFWTVEHRYNIIILEDHILQEEFNNLTRITLAGAYPPHLIIKNIKKDLIRSHNHLLSQQAPHGETNILPIVNLFSEIGKQLTAIIHRNWHNAANGTTLSKFFRSLLT